MTLQGSSYSPTVRCPKCHNKLLQKSGDSTRLRIEGVVTIDSKGIAKACCFWCKSVVELPIELKKSALPMPDEKMLYTIPAEPPKAR